MKIFQNFFKDNKKLNANEIAIEIEEDKYQKLDQYLNNHKLIKLWENSNTENTFSPQTITLLNDDYDYLVWFYFDDVANNYSMSRECLKGSGTVLNHAFAGSVTNISRTIVRMSDTQFSIQQCQSVTPSGTTTTNDRLIPTVVYGVKF